MHNEKYPPGGNVPYGNHNRPGGNIPYGNYNQPGGNTPYGNYNPQGGFDPTAGGYDPTTGAFDPTRGGYGYAPPEPPKKRRSNTPVIILLSALLAVLLILGVILLVWMNKEEFRISTASSNVRYGTVTGGGVYRDGETVTLTAIPSSGCIFYQWSDGSTQPTRTIHATSDQSYTAVFYGPVQDWSADCPDDAFVVDTRTVYCAVTDTMTTTSASVPSGYVETDSYWELSDTEHLVDVDNWPSGFSTSHPLYSRYSGSQQVTAYENESTKVEVIEDSDGYIYWHWCRGTRVKGAINRTATMQRDAEFNTFHAYFSTREPMASGPKIPPTYHDKDEVDNPTGLNAYHQPNNDCCTDSYWFYALDVNAKTVNTYEKMHVYERISEPQTERPSGGSYTEMTQYQYRLG